MVENTKKRKLKPNINIWLDVKSDIEIKIINGDFPSGKRIPSIVKIAEMYNIGNSTSKKVLASLCDDDEILIKQKGVGYFVKPYVKERLLKKHKKNINQQLKEISIYAKKIGIEKELVGMLKEILTEK